MPTGRILAHAAAACLLGLLLAATAIGPAHAMDKAPGARAGDGMVPVPSRKPARRCAARRTHAAHQARHPTTTANGGSRQLGNASWYGSRHAHKRTASGDRFDPNRLTAAHPTLPMNTRVQVTNLANGRQVTVTVNDRSSPSGHRVIDLSPRAAEALAMKHHGLVPVIVEVLPPDH